MTVTGLTKVLEDISDAIYEDLLMILPWSVLFTVLVITVLHRSAKVVVITGTPIMMALAITFGFLGDHGHHPNADDCSDVSNPDRPRRGLCPSHGESN